MNKYPYGQHLVPLWFGCVSDVLLLHDALDRFAVPGLGAGWKQADLSCSKGAKLICQRSEQWSRARNGVAGFACLNLNLFGYQGEVMRTCRCDFLCSFRSYC